MFSQYDVQYLNEYLGQYVKHLILMDSDSEFALGMLLEGAARFVFFVESKVNENKEEECNGKVD